MNIAVAQERAVTRARKPVVTRLTMLEIATPLRFGATIHCACRREWAADQRVIMP